MKTPEEIFRFKAEYYSLLFQIAAKCGLVDQNTFDIQNHYFDDKYKTSHDVRYNSPFETMFKWLALYEDYPCVYRWELIPPYDECEIKEVINGLRDASNLNMPYVDMAATTTTNTLYVGKAEGCVWGRQIEHLGYHKKAQTHHGLHIHDWAQQRGLSFKLHVFVFPKECSHILELFEYALAKEYKPLIGSHK